jgi:hypothetical protein
VNWAELIGHVQLSHTHRITGQPTLSRRVITVGEHGGDFCPSAIIWTVSPGRAGGETAAQGQSQLARPAHANLA